MQSEKIETVSNFKLKTCPICHSGQFITNFVSKGFPVQQCQLCSLKFLNPQPSNEDLAEIYSANYFLLEHNEAGFQEFKALKTATANLYLDLIAKYLGKEKEAGDLLEVGSGTGDLLLEAQNRGYKVTGIEYSTHVVATAQARLGNKGGRVIVGELDTVDLAPESFDLCILSDVLEHVRNPEHFLQKVYELLKPGGCLFLATPSLDSWSAQLLGKHWMEYKTEHLFYFDKLTLQNLLHRTNFREVKIEPNYKILTPEYIFAHFKRYPVPLFTPVATLMLKVVPKFLLRQKLKIVASGVITLTRKQATTRQKLSIVMPVYNEKVTFSQIIEQVLQKEIADLDIEVIIVESNSSDGTREEVLKYQNHPRVKLILEDKPNGKGHAVRTGLEQATGDFILIQDADLEYKVEDYDALLEPLQQGRTAFVLGSRHGHTVSSWKMRKFTDQPVTAVALNFGHILFTTLINLFFGQKLKDPFTMYKVFRRDCLYGLKFECNRFDFDFELVIKLLRKGYKPIEIPVNYCSRSFKEGKKVSAFRDPLTWIRALLKYRFVSIYKDNY
jgi:2-polyprenyl-3-methyl-5-hydroxy-6-metoxy-1,4-benzoquinol methylase